MTFENFRRDRVVYGVFGIYSGQTHPLGSWIIESACAKSTLKTMYSPSHGYMKNWDAFFKHCLFDLEFYNGDTSNLTQVFYKKQFDSEGEMINFINNNISVVGTSTSEDVKVTVYNVVDEQIPTVDKIFGYNALFTALLGTSGLRKRAYVMTEAEGNGFNYLNDFIIDAYQNIFGVDVSSDLSANATMGQRSVWVQRKLDKGLYRLPALNTQISTGNNGRTSFNTSTNTFESATSGNYVLIDVAFAYYSDTINSFPVKPEFTNDLHEVINLQQGRENSSIVAVYGLQSGTQRALYIKPYGGIDTFVVPKFDTGLYRLEAIYTKNSEAPKLSIIPDPSANDGHGLYSRRYRKKAFTQHLGIPSQKVANIDAVQNVEFILRRLNTPYVSRIGAGYIYADVLSHSLSCPVTYYVGYKRRS